METSVRLYALNYDEAKTYLWAAVFVACNLILLYKIFESCLIRLNQSA